MVSWHHTLPLHGLIPRERSEFGPQWSRNEGSGRAGRGLCKFKASGTAPWGRQMRLAWDWQLRGPHAARRLASPCIFPGTGSSLSPGGGARLLGNSFSWAGPLPLWSVAPQRPREAAKGKRVAIALLVSLPTKPPVPRRRLQEEVPPAADTCALTAQPGSGASAPRTRCSLEPPAHPPRCPGPPRISPSDTHTATCTRERPLTQTCTGCVQKPCPGPTPAVAERGLSTE